MLKFALPWLKKTTTSVDVSSVEAIVVAPTKAAPFTALDDHLARLVAEETATAAAHERATLELHDYMKRLAATVETHQASVRALYGAPPLKDREGT